MNETLTARKFLFDRSFSGDMPSRPKPKPTYSHEQVEQIRQEAYDSGFAAGQKAMTDSQNRQVQSLLTKIDQKLAQLAESGTQMWQKQMAHLREATVMIARKILPAYVERHGLEEIESIIAKVVTEMAHEPRLVVRVGEAQFDAISAKIKDITDQAAYAGKVVTLAEADLGPADCRIEWADGGIERDTEALWQNIGHIMGATEALAKEPAAPAKAESETPAAALDTTDQPPLT